MKTLIKVLTALLAVGGVAYWVFCRLRDSKLRKELEEMDAMASDLYADREEEEAEEESAEETDPNA